MVPFSLPWILLFCLFAACFFVLRWGVNVFRGVQCMLRGSRTGVDTYLEYNQPPRHEAAQDWKRENEREDAGDARGLPG